VAPPTYTRRSYPSYTTRKPAVVSSSGSNSKSAKTNVGAGGGSGGSYQVQEGDTLYRIAVNHGVDPDTLQAMNPELAGRAHAIQVGEYVRVPRK
jgi:LysM repeat protein